MTGMEHAIEQAADVLGAHQWSAAAGGCRGGSCQWHGGDSEDEQERHAAHVARALAEAGLLAPAPLIEETETDQIMQWGGPVAVIERRRRWVTDWYRVEPADPAEGDGSTDQ